MVAEAPACNPLSVPVTVITTGYVETFELVLAV